MRGGPVDMQLIQLISIVLAIGVLITFGYSAKAMLLDSRADSNQGTQLNKLVHEISLVCQFGGPRNMVLTSVPKRGFVYIEGLSQEYEKQKIVEETGCTQYCLCAIRREEEWQEGVSEPGSGYYTRAYFTGNNKQELREMVADFDTKIIGCINLQEATRKSDGQVCFKDATLLFDDADENCQRSPNYWGMPVFRDFSFGVLECGGSMATFDTCPSNARVTIDKSNNELTINPAAYWWELEYPECGKPEN